MGSTVVSATNGGVSIDMKTILESIEQFLKDKIKENDFDFLRKSNRYVSLRTNRLAKNGACEKLIDFSLDKPVFDASLLKDEKRPIIGGLIEQSPEELSKTVKNIQKLLDDIFVKTGIDPKDFSVDHHDFYRRIKSIQGNKPDKMNYGSISRVSFSGNQGDSKHTLGRMIMVRQRISNHFLDSLFDYFEKKEWFDYKPQWAIMRDKSSLFIQSVERFEAFLSDFAVSRAVSRAIVYYVKGLLDRGLFTSNVLTHYFGRIVEFFDVIEKDTGVGTYKVDLQGDTAEVWDIFQRVESYSALPLWFSHESLFQETEDEHLVEKVFCLKAVLNETKKGENKTPFENKIDKIVKAVDVQRKDGISNFYELRDLILLATVLSDRPIGEQLSFVVTQINDRKYDVLIDSIRKKKSFIAQATRDFHEWLKEDMPIGIGENCHSFSLFVKRDFLNPVLAEGCSERELRDHAFHIDLPTQTNDYFRQCYRHVDVVPKSLDLVGYCAQVEVEFSFEERFVTLTSSQESMALDRPIDETVQKKIFPIIIADSDVMLNEYNELNTAKDSKTLTGKELIYFCLRNGLPAFLFHMKEESTFEKNLVMSVFFFMIIHYLYKRMGEEVEIALLHYFERQGNGFYPFVKSLEYFFPLFSQGILSLKTKERSAVYRKNSFVSSIYTHMPVQVNTIRKDIVVIPVDFRKDYSVKWQRRTSLRINEAYHVDHQGVLQREAALMQSFDERQERHIDPYRILSFIEQLKHKGIKHVVFVAPFRGRMSREEMKDDSFRNKLLERIARSNMDGVQFYFVRHNKIPMFKQEKRVFETFHVIPQEVFGSKKAIIPLYSFASMKNVGGEEEGSIHSMVSSFYLDVRPEFPMNIESFMEISPDLYRLFRLVHYVESEKPAMPTMNCFSKTYETIEKAGEFYLQNSKIVFSYPGFFSHLHALLEAEASLIHEKHL